MADLGVINVVDTGRGTQPVSRNAELAALNTGLNVAGKIIDEGAKADLRGDLEQAQQDSITAASAASEQPDFTEFESADDSVAVVGFVNQMRKHSAMAAQATSSNLKSRAVLAMQQELQNAKNKYPWMRATLDQEANRFMGSSPTLTALGLIDASIKAGTHPATMSQDWIDGVKETAYGKGPNQLGMDERIEFGTPEFSREYDKKMNRLQARQGLERDEALAKAKDTADIRELVTIGTRHLESAEGDLSTMYDSFSIELRQVQDARMQFRAGRISEAALLAQEDEYNRDVLPQLKLQIGMLRAQMKDAYNELIPFHLQDEPDAVALKGRVDTHSQDLATLQTTLEADNTNIVELINTLSMMRGQNRLQQAPTLQEFTDLANISSKALTAMGELDFSFASAYDQQLITNGMGPEIMNNMFPSLAADWRDTQGAFTPEERRRRRSEAYTRSSAPGGRVTTNDPDVIAQDNISQLLKIAHSIGVPELQDPTADMLNVGSWAAHLQSLATAKPESLDDSDRLNLRDAASSTEWVGSVDRVGKNSPEVKEWVANMEQDYLGVIDKPKDWVNDMAQTSAQKMGGFTGPAAMTLMDIETDALFTTGQIVFIANPNKIEAAFPLSAEGDTAGQTSFFGLGSSVNDRTLETRKTVEHELNTIAQRMTEDASAYVRVMAHLAYAKNPALAKPEYGAAFVEPVPGAPALDVLFKIDVGE